MYEKKSILIVDDDTLSINFLIELLKDHYILYIAKNGEAAINMALQNSPSLILLDIIMPNVDGYQILSFLRNTPETKHTPVIFMSSLSSPHHEEIGLSLEANDYIKKPFNEHLVKLRIDNQLNFNENIIKKIPSNDLNSKDDFYETLERKISEANKNNSKLSLILADIDKLDDIFSDNSQHIKRILSSYISIAIKNVTRQQQDYVAALSSGEFAILLPDTDINGAVTITSRLTTHLSQNPLFINGKEINVTLSIGVTDTLQQKSDEFIQTAFSALKQAQKKGNGNVHIYQG